MSTDHTALRERLQALPEPSPPPGGWERLQQALEAPPRHRSLRRPTLALAASVLLALALAWTRTGPPLAETPEQAQATELAGLIAQSQALEQRLHRLRPEVPVWDARLAATAEDLETDLAVVDLQLNVADDAAQRPLWRNRVALMSQLVETHRAAALQTARPESPTEMSL